MNWIARVELFEQLRQEHDFGVGTIAGVAAKFGVHRRMVRQAIAGALPLPHRYPARAKPKLEAVVAFIDEVLDADRHAARKQRHTARQIFRRILTEFPDAVVAESTVRNHVRARKREVGLVQRETFVPQSYALGQEAQENWNKAYDALRSSFERLVSAMDQTTAQRLWRDAARGPRGRPFSTRDPEQAKALLVENVLVLSNEQISRYLAVASQLRKSFELVAFTLGQESAQQLWRDAARRPRGRPSGSRDPEKDKELLCLTDGAINRSNPVPLWQLANFIHEKLPLEFGPSPKAIEMRLRRLIASQRKF